VCTSATRTSKSIGRWADRRRGGSRHQRPCAQSAASAKIAEPRRNLSQTAVSRLHRLHRRRSRRCDSRARCRRKARCAGARLPVGGTQCQRSCPPSAGTSAGQSRHTATSNRCLCLAGTWRSRAGVWPVADVDLWVPGTPGFRGSVGPGEWAQSVGGAVACPARAGLAGDNPSRVVDQSRAVGRGPLAGRRSGSSSRCTGCAGR
jgi:hypothetical protein